VVVGDVSYVGYDPITHLNLGPDDRQCQITTFDRKGACSRPRQNVSATEDPVRHPTKNSIPSWLRAAGFDLRAKQMLGFARRSWLLDQSA